MPDLRFEYWALLVTLAWAVIAPRWARPVHRALMAGCARLGRRPRVWILASALLAGSVSAVAAHLVLWPEPSIHDEFSYLLAADTFAGGDLTRPTHPHWEHFESFHTIHEPTYASKYPPAQGLALSVGIALFDQPAFGLWLQAAMMCAAIAWMLFGWLPRRWAVLGSLVALLRLGVTGPWVQTFWGGAVAATGGALVLGALPRILRRPTVLRAAILGAGLSILANSRPYEGMIAALPVCAVLLAFLVRRWGERGLHVVRRLLVPLAGVLALTALGMAYYNWRVTEDPLTLPYNTYDKQYSVYPAFLWQPTSPTPTFNHGEMGQFALGFQSGDYSDADDLGDLLYLAYARTRALIKFYLGYLLLAPLLALPFCGCRPRVVLACVTCALVLAGLFATSYLQVHYAAPAFSALVLLIAAGWRGLTRLPFDTRRRGQAISAGLAIGLLLLATKKILYEYPAPSAEFGPVRAEHRDALLQHPGRDLVIVSYSENHSLHEEWVYNAADIDAAPIVWARDMGAEKNASLREYFADRVVWSLVAGDPGSVEARRPRELRRTLVSTPGAR